MEQEATLSPPATESPAAEAPVIGKNLFWDDYRIGLKTTAWGSLSLLIVSVLLAPLLPSALAALLVFAAGVATLLGVKISANVPEETGASVAALATLGLTFVAFLCVIVGYLFSSGATCYTIAAVAGSLAFIGYNYVANAACKYLRLRALGLYATAALGLAVLSAAVFCVTYLAGLMAGTGFRVLVQLLIAASVAFTSYIAFQLAGVIRRGQLGLPLEADLGEAESAAEEIEVGEEPPPLTADVDVEHLPEAEVKALRSEDTNAAKAVVVLMAGVFSVGVVLYTIIAIVAGLWPFPLR